MIFTIEKGHRLEQYFKEGLELKKLNQPSYTLAVTGELYKIHANMTFDHAHGEVIVWEKDFPALIAQR